MGKKRRKLRELLIIFFKELTEEEIGALFSGAPANRVDHRQASKLMEKYISETYGEEEVENIHEMHELDDEDMIDQEDIEYKRGSREIKNKQKKREEDNIVSSSEGENENRPKTLV